MYGHMDFKGVPLNLLEVLLLVAGSVRPVRSAYTQTADFRPGPLLWPIGVYMAFVAAGLGQRHGAPAATSRFRCRRSARSSTSGWRI